MAVASILASLHMDDTTIMAGFMHDVGRSPEFPERFPFCAVLNDAKQAYAYYVDGQPIIIPAVMRNVFGKPMNWLIACIRISCGIPANLILCTQWP